MKNKKVAILIAVILTAISVALAIYLVYELLQKPDDPAALILRAGAAIGSFMLAADIGTRTFLLKKKGSYACSLKFFSLPRLRCASAARRW
jgi:hypothetical protein